MTAAAAQASPHKAAGDASFKKQAFSDAAASYTRAIKGGDLSEAVYLNRCQAYVR